MERRSFPLRASRMPDAERTSLTMYGLQPRMMMSACWQAETLSPRVTVKLPLGFAWDRACSTLFTDASLFTQAMNLVGSLQGRSSPFLEEGDSCISLREVRIPDRMAMPMLPKLTVSVTEGENGVCEYY